MGIRPSDYSISNDTINLITSNGGTKGQHALSLALPDTPLGMYFLQFHIGVEVYAYKVIK